MINIYSYFEQNKHRVFNYGEYDCGDLVKEFVYQRTGIQLATDLGSYSTAYGLHKELIKHGGLQQYACRWLIEKPINSLQENDIVLINLNKRLVFGLYSYKHIIAFGSNLKLNKLIRSSVTIHKGFTYGLGSSSS